MNDRTGNPIAATPAVETRALRKLFADKVAVADVTLRLEAGEIFGFLGPNGAGKTTAVKMLLGLVHPTAGEARVLGGAPGDPRTRTRVGFLPEHFRFHDWLTGAEFLALHADLYGIPRPTARRRAGDLLDRVGLTAHAGKRLRHYSKGMLQRIGLAQALLNEPEIVFLDEPTSGLDPGGRLLVREILRDLSRQGTAVFLNSHLLGEVEAVCDRVAFVRQGVVLRDGTLASLFDSAAITVTAEIRGLTAEHAAAMRAAIAPWASAVGIDGDHVTCEVESEAHLPLIHRALVALPIAVHAFTPRRPTLEELFMAIVGPADRTRGDGGDG